MKRIAFSLFALLSFALMSATLPEQGYRIGDIVADFKLRNVDGKMVSMKDNATAKGYIIAFTCNECPYAKLYEDRLVALHNLYAPKGYPVLAINPNGASKIPGESFEDMKTRVKEKKLPYAYLEDETQEVTKAFGAARTPHMYIVSRDGSNFKLNYIGAIDDNAREPENVKTKYVEEAMAEIMAGKPVTNNNTRAIGCTIKWKPM